MYITHISYIIIYILYKLSLLSFFHCDYTYAINLYTGHKMQSYEVSIGQNILDNSPKDITLSYDELRQLLTTYKSTATKKGSGIYMVSGHFLGRKRLQKNLVKRTLISYDLDYCSDDIYKTSKKLQKEMHGIHYIIYSTSSHTPDKPRLRLVLFPDVGIPTDQYKAVSLKLLDNYPYLKGIVDESSSCMSANNAMFLPIKTSDDYIPWTYEGEGEKVPVSKIISTSTSTTDSDDPLDQPILFRKLDIPDYEVQKFLDSYNASVCDYKRWLGIGMALHHQYSGEDKALKMWTLWSEFDPKYKDIDVNKECRYKWTTFRDTDTPKTLSSIMNDVRKERLSEPVLGNTSIKVARAMKPKSNHAELVPSHYWFQVKGEKCIPIFCTENFKKLLEFYNIGIFYDIISKREVISFDGIVQRNMNAAMTDIKSLAIRNNLSHLLVPEWVIRISRDNEINPFKTWVTSKAWDGVDRLSEICETVVVSDRYIDTRNRYLKSWLLQLMHSVCLNDGPRPKMARLVLVFQSKQGGGKTSWFRNLLPDDLNHFLLEGQTLNVASDMDRLSCLQRVMVELGELDSTFRKSDIEQLKNFITATKDSLNMKYVPYPVEFRRRTVFFASVNDISFLSDDTGNTRFLALPIESCDYDHKIDHQQLYAQMYHEALKGNEYWLDDDGLKEQKEINDSFSIPCSIEDKIREMFECDEVNFANDEIRTATNVLETLGFSTTINRRDQLKVAKVLDKMGFPRYTKPKGWMMPRLKSDIMYYH